MNTAALWLACVFAGLANPPAPPVPRVLVDAPIAARIAANDIAHWKALGASGFLFSGIYDDFTGAPQEGLQDFGPTAPESSLLKEIRLSIDELESNGIDQNFLRATFAPNRPWFSDRDRAREALQFFQGLGIFCQRAGLRGIALDLAPNAPIYQYAWPEYDLATLSTTRLAESARELGRRGMRAYIREVPDANLLFIARDIEHAGPLFFAFLEGLIESVGAASSMRLDLAVPMPPEAKGFDAAASYLADLEAQLCDAFGEEARRIWQRQGGFVPLLRPNFAPEALASWRTQVAVAKLVASDYIAVQGDYGAWWSLSEKQAKGYAKLRQRPGGTARATPRPVDGQKAWDFNTPFDRFERVGTHSEIDAAPYVFADGPRAAALFWAAPAKPLVPDAGASALLRTSLATRETKTLAPEDGDIKAERIDTPALIAGLPLAPWAAPAALWCAFDATPTAGQGRVPLRFGVRNVFPGDLSGSIEVTTPDALSLGTGTFPILLRPGQSTVFERWIQGRFSLEEPVRLTLSLKSPVSPGVERRIRATTHLATRWQYRRDAAIHAAPLVLPGADPIVVVASDAGDVAGYTSEGVLVWQRRYPPPLRLARWAGRDGAAPPRIAIADGRGMIRVLVSRSEPVWEAQGEPGIVDLQFVDLFANGRDCLLVQSTGHTIQCYSADGKLAWQRADGGEDHPYLGSPAAYRQYSVAQEPRRDEDRLYLAVPGKAPTLCRVGGNGGALWTRALPAAPTLAPVFLPEQGSLPARLAVRLADDTLAFYRADIGAPLEVAKPAIAGHWRECLPIELDPQHDGPEMLVIGDEALALLDQRGVLLWSQAGLAARQAALLDDPRGPALLVLGREQLTALSPGGKLLWKDRPLGHLRSVAATLSTLLFTGTSEGLFQAFERPTPR